MPAKLTTKQLIERLKEKFKKYNYDYSQVSYIGQRTKIKIICPVHGERFCSPEYLLSSKGHICSLCESHRKGTPHKKINTQSFIEKAKEVHGNKFDYSLTNYINEDTKIKIICPIHGIFEQLPLAHISSVYGCYMCAPSCKYTSKTFLEKVKEIHKNKYDYSLVNYKDIKTKIKIICPKHGVFEQSPLDHIRGHGCISCALERSKSKGCSIIEQYFTNNNILFEKEKTFQKCKGKKKLLPFDYYIPSKNILIEYDGEQHYKKKFNMTDKEFEDIRRNDKTKTDFCLKNNIQLIRISYKENKEINDILSFIVSK